MNEDGKEYITNLYHAGDYLGHITLLENKNYDDTAEILEDAEIIAVNANQLFKLYDTFPEIERLFRKIFEAAYDEHSHRIARLYAEAGT